MEVKRPNNLYPDPRYAEQRRNGSKVGAEAMRRTHLGGKLHGGAQSVEPMSDDEWEFARAMRSYCDTTHHQFPTYSECLHVLRGLGYRKL
jgi:hypothetical protein